MESTYFSFYYWYYAILGSSFIFLTWNVETSVLLHIGVYPPFCPAARFSVFQVLVQIGCLMFIDELPVSFLNRARDSQQESKFKLKKLRAKHRQGWEGVDLYIVVDMQWWSGVFRPRPYLKISSFILSFCTHWPKTTSQSQ